MARRFHPGRPSPERGLRRSIALVTVLAGALLSTMPARADLLITSSARSVFAQTNFGAGPVFEAAVNADGLFDKSVLTQVNGGPANGALATATQHSEIGQLAFSGSGQASMTLKDGVAGFAESRLSLDFTLTSSFGFSGTALLSTSGQADSHATLVLDALGPGGGSILAGSETSALLPFSGTLGPGSYRFDLRAQSDGFNAAESGDAAFSFNLAFSALAEPPAAVPEPSALALVLAGLLACADARRRLSRRPLKPSPCARSGGPLETP